MHKGKGVKMETVVKIKISDDESLRKRLDNIYRTKTQVQLARWALMLAKHILEIVDFNYASNEIIQQGFAVNEAWQREEVRMHEVRQAGFQVHRLARECNDKVTQAALRVAGQAIGTGHMREHAMVASDYAIKTMNLKYPNNVDEVVKERKWQITTMEFI